MEAVSELQSPKKKTNFLPGPNLCSQVGANVSKILQAALIEMCRKHGGQLTPTHIDHVFDIVMNSTELFPIYQHRYSSCVSLKNGGQFDQVNENKVMNFVVGAFCRDVIDDLIRENQEHDEYENKKWRSALIQGFADFLCSNINENVRSQLFSNYQKLVMQHGGSLSSITILNSEEVIDVFANTMSMMKEKLRAKPKLTSQLNWAPLNYVIVSELEDGHRAGGWVEHTTVLEFIRRLFAPAKNSHFRQVVLLSIDSSAG